MGGATIFDNISKDDLILAFYPCIFFCATSQMAFYLGCTNYRCLTDSEKITEILKRSDNRKYFYDTLVKFVGVCLKKNLRMILENPWSEQTYLKANFLKAPDIVDMDRSLRGDYFKKPTAFWFWNCEPTRKLSIQKNENRKTIMTSKGASSAGLCSEDRSMISSDYARNFICDFILGKEQDITQPTLF